MAGLPGRHVHRSSGLGQQSYAERAERVRGGVHPSRGKHEPVGAARETHLPQWGDAGGRAVQVPACCLRRRSADQVRVQGFTGKRPGLVCYLDVYSPGALEHEAYHFWNGRSGPFRGQAGAASVCKGAGVHTGRHGQQHVPLVLQHLRWNGRPGLLCGLRDEGVRRRRRAVPELPAQPRRGGDCPRARGLLSGVWQDHQLPEQVHRRVDAISSRAVGAVCFLFGGEPGHDPVRGEQVLPVSHGGHHGPWGDMGADGGGGRTDSVSVPVPQRQRPVFRSRAEFGDRFVGAVLLHSHQPRGFCVRVRDREFVGPRGECLGCVSDRIHQRQRNRCGCADSI